MFPLLANFVGKTVWQAFVYLLKFKFLNLVFNKLDLVQKYFLG